jgi:hypothetical protein
VTAAVAAAAEAETAAADFKNPRRELASGRRIIVFLRVV